MKVSISGLLFALQILFGCESDLFVKDYKNVPKDVDRYIHENKINPIKISRIEYGEPSSTGFLIIPDCCDRYMVVLDGGGNYVCAPSGGFTGRGDAMCPDFYNSLVRMEILWQKNNL